MLTREQIVEAFQGLLGRKPESDEVIDGFMAQGHLQTVLHNIIRSPEFRMRYGGDGSSPHPISWDGLERIAFVHIPKAGGTSVRMTLADWYGSGALSPLTGIGFHRAPIPDLASHRIYAGHFGHALTRLLPRPLKRLTVLRDPVARQISNYHWLRAHDRMSLERAGNLVGVKAHELDIDAFFTDPLVRRSTGVDNVATRFLSDTDPKHGDGEAITAAALIDEAKHNLAAFDAIGITEDMPATIRSFARVLGQPVPKTIRRDNSHDAQVGRGAINRIPRQEPTTRTLELIEPLVVHDRELYAMAKERLETS